MDDARQFARGWQMLFAAFKEAGLSDEEARLRANAEVNKALLQRVGRAMNAGQASATQNAYNQEQQERYRREQEQRLRREQERRREQQQHQEAAQANDEGGEEEGEAHVEIYEQYRPAKVTEGPPHPDAIVETASLASVTPPDITYKHHLQENLKRNELSNAQLETVLYAFQRFQTRLPDGNRAGFFLGDGAGVGKGRQIAAVIKEFWATGGRRVLWVSTSNDLRYDARRDLSDLGVADDKIPVYPPRKDNVPSGNLERIYPKGGVLFITYQLLVSKGSYKPPAASGGGKKGRNSGGSDAVAGTASGRGRSRVGEVVDDETMLRALDYKRAEVRRLFGVGSRLHQIVNWLGGPKGDGECLIVLDECHKAKNLLDAAGNSSQTGLAVESLQDQLPNARVLYSSATGASEPNNLRYMVRLGSFGYPHIGDMINSLNRSGLGALEMFSMGLKATGTYVSRTLSYKGAEFKTEELQIDPIFSVMYDRACAIWSLVHNVMRALPKAKNVRGRDVKSGLFWGAHQRFFRQMLIASKVRRCAELAQDALERGMCVVIGLQSTGEASLNSAREAAAGTVGNGNDDSMDDFVSAPRMILHNFIAQWLFHFTEPVHSLMSKKKMQHLQSEIYRACREWKKQPSAAEEADTIMRLKKREAAQEASAAARAAAAAGRSAAATGALQAEGSSAAPSAYGTSQAAKPAPRYDELDDEDDDSIGVEIPFSDEEGGEIVNGAGATAPAGGAAGAGAGTSPAQGASRSDSGDELEVVKERTLEEVLAERRRCAVLAGELIDLADGDCDSINSEKDAERTQLLAQADAEEAAEAEAAAQRKREERRAKLVAALAEAREDADKARNDVQRLEQAEKGLTNNGINTAAFVVGGGAYGSAAAPPATGRRGVMPAVGGVENSSQKVPADVTDEGLLEDADCDKENAARTTAAAVGSKPSGTSRRPVAAMASSDGEEEDNPPITAPARRGSTGRSRRRGVALLDDDDDADEPMEDVAAGTAGDEPQQQDGEEEQQDVAGADEAKTDDGKNELVAKQRRNGGSRAATASVGAQQRCLGGSIDKCAPSGSSAAEEQRQSMSKKRSRSGTPAGGSTGTTGTYQEEVLSSPIRPSRGAALKAAAKIAASASGHKPSKPPKGPSAPPGAADKVAGAKSGTVGIKVEPGTTGGGAAGPKRAKGSKPVVPDSSDDVIVISDSDEVEEPPPMKQQKGASSSRAMPGIQAKTHTTGAAAGKPTVKEERQAEEDDCPRKDSRKSSKAKQANKGEPAEETEEEEDTEASDEEEGEDDDESEGYDDTMCAKCGGGDLPDTILLCDVCDEGYHMACLKPPLKVVPEGDWHCPKCTTAKAAKIHGNGAAAGEAGQKRKAPEDSGRKAAGGASSRSTKACKASKPSSEDLEDQTGEDEDCDEEVPGHDAKRRKISANGKAAVAATTGAKSDKKGAAADAAAPAKAGAKFAKVAAVGKGRRRAAVDDDEDEGSDEDESSDEELSEESAESVDDSDDDDFIAEGHRGGPKRRGRLQRTAPPRGGRGRPARGAAAWPESDSEEDDKDDVAGCGDRGGPANVFKIRMQLRAAQQRLKEAERRLATAQRNLADHERAVAANRRTNGGTAGGGQVVINSNSDSSSSSSDDDGNAGAQEMREARGGVGPPAVYRHAAKSKPLDKIPKSWKAGKVKGSEGRRRSADSDDDDSDSDDDNGSSSGVTLEDEDDSSDGEEVELVEEDGLGRRRGGGQEVGGSALPSELRKCRAMLLRLLEAQELPLNPLDQLTELMGGESKVAEMTGRKVLQVRTDEGRIVCKQRRDDEAQKMVNMAEKNDFMNGRKLVAIISDAASTGISLQADRRVTNQRRRFHITLELPWSADKAIQQFGRSHRSNQTSAPEYCLLVTKCGGEYRFAGAVAKRLTSLGALLRGDRRALGASSDLKPYDVDNKYGEQAVGRVLECVSSGAHNVAGAKVGELPHDLLPPAAAATPPGSNARIMAFLQHMQTCLKTMGLLTDVGGIRMVEKKDTNTSVVKFLNRLLGLQLRDQDLMFQYFFGIMESLIKQARSAGEYEEGVLNLANSSVEVVQEQAIHVDAATGAATTYIELDVDDGLSFEQACQAMELALADMKSENAPPEAIKRVGFYVSRRNPNVGGTGHPLVILATALRRTTLSSRLALHYRIQRPNQVKGHIFTQYELDEKYRKVDLGEGEKHWKFWYHYLDRGCLHGSDCVRRKRDGKCNYGSRFYSLHIVSGALLPVLRKLFDTVLRSSSTRKAVPRVARVLIKEKEGESTQHQRRQRGAKQQQGAADGNGADAGDNAAGGSAGAGAGPSTAGPGSGRADGRVLVGLSLTERDAQAFLTAVTM
ncbi:hypothetical protein Vretimale_6229 [Volvox reticuliferus]|uniref:PHD-type domain-containing protein n=1 Tax=Volvox reticuliferus TaxID=1737510 RepID=A0A8J4LLF3_9CHLO|nr:hypothetical protein Vretimale_6229 [Volvox reticuliferus]